MLIKTVVCDEFCCIYLAAIVSDYEPYIESSAINPDSNFFSFNAKRKKEWITVRLLLSEVCPGASVAYEQSGKPFLVGTDSTVSISHTSGFVAVMIDSKSRNIGIDIETNLKDTALRVREKFMSVSELNQNLLHIDPLLHSLLHWTAKEAAYKAVGSSGDDFSADYSLSDFRCNSDIGFSCLMHYNRKSLVSRVFFSSYSSFVMAYIIV